MDELDFELTYCNMCALGSETNQIVSSESHIQKDSPIIFFLGEGPGYNESRVGRPFVGKCGKLLRQCMDNANIDSYYICNTVKCRPPDNRNPFCDEIIKCGHYALLEIGHVVPSLIIALGKVATEFLLNFKISHHGDTYNQVRNDEFLIQHPLSGEDYWVLSLYHPAYILRNINKLPAYEKMLTKARKLTEE